MLASVAFAALCGLAVLAALLQITASRLPTSELSTGRNPSFLSFQRSFFVPYFLALFADWLHGPYLYRLYFHYGFQESQIAIIYVSGYFTVAAFGALAGFLLDRIGRKKLCLAFCVTYSVASFAKLSRSYFVLIFGRILGGVAMSLLPAFEKWYTFEHMETGYPAEWIPVTFAKANLWNGIMAVVAGLIAYILAEWMTFGPVAPFVLAIPFLTICAVRVMAYFQENYGVVSAKVGQTCTEGLRTIIHEKSILVAGCVQACFEAAHAAFIFIWTPILSSPNYLLRNFESAPLGICFACFMLATLIGDALFRLASARHISPRNMLVCAIFLALVSTVCAAGAADPYNLKRDFAFFTFILFEVAVGMYFPAMSKLRRGIIPDRLMSAVLNWFRVPVNALACLALVVLHGNSSNNNHMVFFMCSVFLGVALLAALMLRSLVTDKEELNNGDILPVSEPQTVT